MTSRITPLATACWVTSTSLPGTWTKPWPNTAALYQEHPEDIQVKKNYIQLLVQKSRFDEARKLNDEVLKANPQDNEALVSRSQIQISSGNLNDAVATLQAVIKNNPNNAEAHYSLGVALDKSGDLAACRKRMD